MDEKSVIVIGAGLSGLSAGIYAQMNGYSTRILELSRVPGGLAACWKRGKYLIDGGIHFVAASRPDLRVYKLYKEIGVDRTAMKEMTIYGQYVDALSGRTINVTNDLDKLRSDLCSLFPTDLEVINQILSAAKSFAKIDSTDFGLDKPSELMGIRDKLFEMWDMRKFLKYMIGDLSHSVREYVERVTNPLLKEFLQMLFLPTAPVWFIAMILGQVASGQMALLEGGSQDFVRSMEKRYLELGGQVEYQAEVHKILVDSDKAVGVQLKDGREHRADFVIPAIDSHSLIYDLLGGNFVSESINERHHNWRLTEPLLMINYGVRRTFDDEPWMIIWRLANPITIARKPVDHLILRIFNYGSCFSPPGKTVLQVELETEWDYWKNLRVSNEALYREEKARIAQEILKLLEERYPGVSELVEVTDVATPYTTWRYTHNREGSYMGWLFTKDLLTTRLKKTLPGLQNFIMAGQWSIGMGGVIPSIYSGRQAVQLLCHQDGVKFRVDLPKQFREN